MKQRKNIPTYSLDRFKHETEKGTPYQIEVFDANRHFEVEYPHRHDFYEILFLTKGSGIHVIDDKNYEINPPCLFFLSPGQAHKLELSEDVDGYIFLFTSEFYLINKRNKNRLLEFPFFFNLKQENPPLLLQEDKDITFITSLFKKGSEEMSHIGNSGQEFMLSLLDLILNSCNRLYPGEVRSQERGTGHILVKRFRALIEEKYHENLSIKEYANYLCITENHLTQTVKELIGLTSKDLIKAKQLLEIKRLLIYTDLSVAEIAFQLNFKDQSYFTRFFKRETSYSPRDFRNNLNNTTL